MIGPGDGDEIALRGIVNQCLDSGPVENLRSASWLVDQHKVLESVT